MTDIVNGYMVAYGLTFEQAKEQALLESQILAKQADNMVNSKMVQWGITPEMKSKPVKKFADGSVGS